MTKLTTDQINHYRNKGYISSVSALTSGEAKEIREEIENLRSESRDEKLSEEARKNKRLQLEDRLIEMQKVQKELRDFEALKLNVFLVGFNVVLFSTPSPPGRLYSASNLSAEKPT